MAALRFGIASADITPPIGVFLCGYNPRRSESVGHALRAEVLVCDSGAGAWALVTADLLAVSNPLVQDVRADAAKRTGLKPDAIMIAATHTHSGPNTFAVGWRELPEEVEYFRRLRTTLADMIVAAWNARAPGELVHTRTTAPEFGSNRRVQKPDGTWTNEWADPNGTHTGYFDPTVELLGLRRPDGTLESLLVAFGCHPVCFNSQNTAISADYPGHMKDALEATGLVKTTMFAVTGHANVDPRHCVSNDPALTKAQGEKLAAIVKAAIPSLKPVKTGAAAGTREPWDMTIAWSISGNSASYFKLNQPGDIMHSEAGALGVGELAFVCMPGETVSEFMKRFRAESPFGITIMLSVVNDFVGYLVTDAIIAEGAYETMMCPIRPSEAAVMQHGLAALNRIHTAITTTK